MTNPYRRIERMGWNAAVGTGLLALVLTPVGGAPAILGWIAGASFGLLGVFAALLARSLGRRADRHLAEFRAGHHLARWVVPAEEWNAHAERERERIRRTARWLFPGLTLLGGLIGGAIATEEGATALAVGLALGAFVGWGAERLVDLSAGAAVAPAPRDGAEVVLGREAGLINGGYVQWAGFGVSLVGARVVPGAPAVLELTLRQQSGHGPVDGERRIPVPAGREEEALRFAATVHGTLPQPA